MSFEGPLEDRLKIRERYGAYSAAAFETDMEAWLANWTEDGVWRVLGLELRGKPALREQWGVVWTTIQKMAFFSEIGAIRVEGDRASARAYTRETLLMTDGGVREVLGSYDDELVRKDGEWLFASRRHQVRLSLDLGRAAAPFPA
jgi:uncharacterized protein (TIGR02246 family)